MSPFVSTPLGFNKTSTCKQTNVQSHEYPCREFSLTASQSLTARTTKQSNTAAGQQALRAVVPWTVVSRTRTKRQNKKHLHVDKTFPTNRSSPSRPLSSQVATSNRGVRTELPLTNFLRPENERQPTTNQPSQKKSDSGRKRRNKGSGSVADLSGLGKAGASRSTVDSSLGEPLKAAKRQPTPSNVAKSAAVDFPSNALADLSREKVCTPGGTAVAGDLQPASAEPSNVYMADAPKYHGLCGTALCQVMNPVTGRKAPIRILLDSGANMTMIDKHVARSIGLTGQKVLYRINVAGGGVVSHKETEVVFQLVNSNGHATPPLVGMTTEAVGNPFQPVDFNPKKYPHLKDLVLADKFPNPNERSIELLLAEPYYSMFQKEGTRVSENPALPMAQETALGWVLRGATGIHKTVQSGSVFSALSRQEEVFDLETMYTVSYTHLTLPTIYSV